MHKVYTTEAFVIDSRNSIEADKMITLFTKEFGLINAIAKGVRKERSKLRYVLQNNSETLVSLVKGKEYWRITNALHIENHKLSLEDNLILRRIKLFLKRISPPETADLFMFVNYKHLLSLLCSDYKDKNKVEMGMILHVLHRCGYLEEKENLKQFLRDYISSDSLNKIAVSHKEILNIINKAINNSHL